MELTNKDLRNIREIIKKERDPRKIYRANALRLRHMGWTRAEVAEILDVTTRTIINIENTYDEYGLDIAISDNPRSGAPVVFDDRTKSDIIALVCSDPPEGYDRWTLELIQEHAIKRNIVDSISTSTLHIVLKEHDLKPWLQKQWCVPDLTAEYIERMEDVLDVYALPYNPEYPVVCVDEKPIQLLSDIRPTSGVAPGEIKKVDYEYKREGTANVFCAVEPLTGKYVNKVTSQRTAIDFASFLSELEKKYKDAKKIILVLDNLNTHTKKSLEKKFNQEKADSIWNRFEVHYTPTHASWLNQAEIAIGMYSRQCLGRTRIPDIETLKKKTTAWNRSINRKNAKIEWKFNKSKARKKFKYKV